LERVSRSVDSGEARDQNRAALAEIAGDVDGIMSFPSSGPRIKAIVARGSKTLRMQLVAPLFETGRACLVGHLPQAEFQLSTWLVGMDSPDRADAVVHTAALLAGVTGVASIGRSTDRVPTNSTSLRNKSSSRITRSTRR
jgi:phage terminase large subunit-like protein